MNSESSKGNSTHDDEPLSPDELVHLTRAAGREILRWYGKPGEVEAKADRTPLTQADRAAHQLIVRELARLTPDIPVLSEESAAAEIGDRRNWRRFWLVDPLDGTKEFLKGTGEFTVNVALVDDGRPVMGVVHVPAFDRTYRASPRLGAEMGEGEGPFQVIRTRSYPADAPVVVASKDHAGPGVQALAAALGPRVQFASLGSSLKFCLVAEGRADLYLRDLPTMEWDTGAAQCIVERAGGAVYGLPEPEAESQGDDPLPDSLYRPLQYNKASLKNPPFLAVGDPGGPWRGVVPGADQQECE